MTPFIKFSFVDDNGFDCYRNLPARYEVCPRCDGHGSHVNPAIDGNGISSDEWSGPDWDDESRDAYLSGGYDVTCHTCGGERVVAVLDEAACPPDILAEYRDHQRDLAELDATERAERACGA